MTREALDAARSKAAELLAVHDLDDDTHVNDLVRAIQCDFADWLSAHPDSQHELMQHFLRHQLAYLRKEAKDSELSDFERHRRDRPGEYHRYQVQSGARYPQVDRKRRIAGYRGD